MKLLYLDCGMGAAGDMMTAALLELLPRDEQDRLLEKLQGLGLEGVTISREKFTRCGIAGTHVDVRVNGISEISDDVHEHHEHEHNHEVCSDQDDEHEHSHDREHHHDHEAGHHHAHSHGHDSDQHEHHHDHAHHHAHMSDIEKIVDGLSLSDKVKHDVKAVYSIIAEAESHAHGVEVTEVHFHEVGMKDAIMDVAAVCMLMERISPNKVIASPIQVGSGQVRCAHGIMPVPAPATAFILRDVPIYSTDIRGELCTPTGAALLRYFVDEYKPMPPMSVSAIGYGMGTKEFPVANCLRAMLGESAEKRTEQAPSSASIQGNVAVSSMGQGLQNGDTDTVIGLSCNLDDMTGEEIGFAMDMLYKAGAREVYTSPIGMKKSRPGVMLTVLCQQCDREKMVGEMFKHTTTIGIRESVYHRYILERTEEAADTPYGKAHYKRSKGYGVSRRKCEYEDLSGFARDQGTSILDIKGKLGDL